VPARLRPWGFFLAATVEVNAWSQALPASVPGTLVGPAQPPSEEDGNDDPEDPGTGTIPPALRLEYVGRSPAALPRVCDLTPFRGALYAAYARTPLSEEGAIILRYVPDEHVPFSVAFDWNRPGQSRRGGGGRGFVRIRTIDGRLYVPDVDTPGMGFGAPTQPEGYVFVSDREGNFAPARGPTFRPPPAFDATRAGVLVVPRARNVLDVVRFRGQLYVSTSSVPPGASPRGGSFPGALHLADPEGCSGTYLVDHPNPHRPGTWRIGFMVRFRERIYMGFERVGGVGDADYLWALPPAGARSITGLDLHPERVTPTGGALTLRWYTDRGWLYWIAYDRMHRVATLRVSEDGDRWSQVTFPPDAGQPTDLTRFRDGLVVLTTRALWRIDGAVPVRLANIPRGPSGWPFEPIDPYCAAPLAVYRNTLYAGGQRDGALYRFVE